MKRTIVLVFGIMAVSIAATPQTGSSLQIVAKKPEPGRQIIKELADSFSKKSEKAKSAEDLVEALALVVDAADELKSNSDIASGVERLVKHRDAAVRYQAVVAMGNLRGPTIYSFVGSIVKCLDDPDDKVKTAAAEALYKRNPYRRAIPKLTELTKHKNPEVKAKAVACLGFYGQYFKEALVPVIAALGDESAYGNGGRIRLLALGCLETVGPEAKDSAPRIVELLEKEKWHPDKFRMVRALAIIDPSNQAVLKSIREWIKPIESDQLRVESIGIVGGLGQHAKSAVPDLVNVLKKTGAATAEKDISMKAAVLRALAKLGPVATEAVPAVEAITTATDRHLREQASKTLKAIQGAK